VFRRSVCWDARFDGIERVGSMAIARRTHRRSAASAAWGLCTGLLLHLYDAKRLLGRLARRAGGGRPGRVEE
jgi:hypothetical protein